MLCVSLTFFGLSYCKCLLSCELSLSNKLPYYFFFIVYIFIISYNLTWSNRAATLPCPYGLHRVSVDNRTLLWWQSSGLDWTVSESQLYLTVLPHHALSISQQLLSSSPSHLGPSSLASSLSSLFFRLVSLIEPMKDSGYTEQPHLWVWFAGTVLLCFSLTFCGLSYMKCLVSCELSLFNKLPDYFLFIVYIVIISFFFEWGGGGGGADE